MSDPRRRERLLEYFRDPPSESALARAIAFGIDPTLALDAMFNMSFDERVIRAGRAIRQMRQMHALRDELRRSPK